MENIKAEYFSSVFEGFLILLAAIRIAYTAFVRLMHPHPLEAVGRGLLIYVLSSIINFATAHLDGNRKAT
jgi:divalent metal cation (Fe/Co/Zn/Cd) transporter